MSETVFTWGAPPVKFGVGATDELGFDLRQLGIERVLIVTDPGVAATGLPERVRGLLAGAGVKAEVYDSVHVEPTDASLREAAEFGRGTDWDGFLAVGGGSSIDTAKAINLLIADGHDVMEYVNRPVGEGRSPTGPLKPLVAVPTTAGTGAHWRWSPGRSGVRSPTVTTWRPARTCSRPRPSPAWASATPASTSRTPAATRSPGRCASTARP